VTPQNDTNDTLDAAPGVIGDERRDVIDGVRTYALGLVFSALLTVLAFHFTKSKILWEPSVPMALAVFAVAQIGVHLVFFVHLTSSPDNVNNTLALAFGTLIVGLLIVGTLYIMQHLGHRTMPAMTASARAVRVEGVVRPILTTPLQARAEGVVASVDCARGAHVEAGEICARLERGPIEKETAQSEAALVAAQAELERDGEKLAALEKRASDPKARQRNAPALEAARTVVKKGEARVASAQAAQAAAAAKLGRLEIVATTKGIVAARNVEAGRRVAPGESPPLFLIEAEPGHVEVSATANMDAAAGLEVGAPVTATAAAVGGRRFTGTVVSLAAADSRASKVEVRVTLADPDRVLRSGMAVSLVLQAP
jgi:cytochrome o ubiquinol oxidase subunit IV